MTETSLSPEMVEYLTANGFTEYPADDIKSYAKSDMNIEAEGDHITLELYDDETLSFKLVSRFSHANFEQFKMELHKAGFIIIPDTPEQRLRNLLVKLRDMAEKDEESMWNKDNREWSRGRVHAYNESIKQVDEYLFGIFQDYRSKTNI